jgi:hypothetical protein
VKSTTIALLTDFGLGDWYVGMMKGVMATVNPGASVVDVCHAIPRHSVSAASFALLASYRFFPEGTVFVIVVDPGVGTSRGILCAASAGRLFVAPDNGTLTGVLAREGLTRMFRVEDSRYFLEQVSSTFHGRDIFAPVAARLAGGLDPAELGPEETEWLKIEMPAPTVRDRSAETQVQWVDSFGNLITDCPAGLARELARKWEGLKVSAETGGCFTMVSTYGEVEPGCPLAVAGSSGYLEISIREGDAADRLGIGVGDKLTLGP